MKSVKKGAVYRAIPYPKLLATERGTVVLMSKAGQGTVVGLDSEESPHTLGDYHEDWVMMNFADYHGSITLSNE